MPRECSNIRRSDRSHNSERARSLSGPELPPLLSYDVHKRDLRYRKISSSRFRFEWLRDSSGKSQLSWRARYLLITPEIRRVDKEFEWMGRIKSFFFSILLANILVRRIIILPIHAGARGWWLRKHEHETVFSLLSFFFFSATTDYYYYYRPIQFYKYNGREKMGRKCRPVCYYHLVTGPLLSSVILTPCLSGWNV